MVALAAPPARSYPQNYLSAKLGANVSTQAKLVGDDDPNRLLSDGPLSWGGIVLGGGQHKEFLVDLGQRRLIDRIDLGTDNMGGGRDIRDLTIDVSSESPEGPFTTVLQRQNLGLFQVLRLPMVRARWVRFDLGDDERDTMVRPLRIYLGYKHPRLARVTKLLHERLKPALPGLEKFYAAAEAKDWPKACSELRAYYAARFPEESKPNPKADLSRAKEYDSGKLNFAGIPRQGRVPIDWAYQKNTDWYEHKNFLNRGAILGVPVDAYWMTGDTYWVDRFRLTLYDWIDANPKPTVMSGANYPTWRTLDSAARASWLMSRFAKVCNGKDIEDELWANYLFSIWEHCDYLRGDDFTGGNWLATNTATVMYIAVEMPEFIDTKLWLEFGKDGFERNVMRDVHPDGKEMEDAPGYVCMAYNGMLGTLQALEKAGIPVSDEIRSRLNKTQDYLIAVTQPNGNTPCIGDWGGGQAYALNNSWPYFKREDAHYALTNGKEGTKPAFTSINFPYGGWSIMRSSYDEKPFENARHLVFKSSRGAHGHEDALLITAYGYGNELLIDPGIRSYEHEDSKRYSQTSYHNTLCIDGKNQGRGAGKTLNWVSNAGIDYVFGSFDYKGLTHRRSVTFVKPEYWVVHDDAIGAGNHTYDQNWHFGAAAKPIEDPSTKAVHTSFKSGGNLLMVPANVEGLTTATKEFFIATHRMGGKKDDSPAKGWKYSRTGEAPQAFDLVLYPYPGSRTPGVSAKALPVDGADATEVTALEVRNGENTDYIITSRVGPRTISVPAAGVTLEGETAVIRMKGGDPVRISGAGVKSISVGGRIVFTTDNPTSDMDQLVTGAE